MQYWQEKVLNTDIRKEDIMKINELSIHLRYQKKEQQDKPEKNQ